MSQVERLYRELMALSYDETNPREITPDEWDWFVFQPAEAAFLEAAKQNEAETVLFLTEAFGQDGEYLGKAYLAALDKHFHSNSLRAAIRRHLERALEQTQDTAGRDWIVSILESYEGVW